MKVTLNHRHHGLHSPVKTAEIPGVLADYATHLERDTYRINEERLLAALPEDFLPVPSSQVLLVVEGDGYATGQGGLTRFCTWGKYFDAYVLGLVDEEGAAPAEEPPTSSAILYRAVRQLRCQHSHPCQPPRGSLAHPGDCRHCGAKYDVVVHTNPIPDTVADPLASLLNALADIAAHNEERGFASGVVQVPRAVDVARAVLGEPDA